VHQAADGGLARIRVPGGTLSEAQFAAVHQAAVDLGDGQLELTSRANIQIRGLKDGVELVGRLSTVGLLPSLTHERVRNIIASPLGDDQAMVNELDHALCADPDLAGLPGRFLVTIDSQGDVSGLGADIGVLRTGETWAVLLAGRDTGIRVAEPVEAILTAAREFLALRGTAWRLTELGDDVHTITTRLGTPGEERVALRPAEALPPGPAGNVLVVGAPLGRLSAAQCAALLGMRLRLTPWRSLVVPALAAAERLAGVGLITDPLSPWHGVTACTGRPGCAKSLADVRADSARWIPGRTGALPVHWSGCERRCGRPAGRAVDIVATADGYEVRSDV
jgi:precorrin-3B synthase